MEQVKIVQKQVSYVSLKCCFLDDCLLVSLMNYFDLKLDKYTCLSSNDSTYNRIISYS